MRLLDRVLNAANPAIISTLLAELFPAGIIAAELREPANSSALHPREAASTIRFSAKRTAEFAAGRLCARRALQGLGIEGFPLTVNADRRPRWPPGVVGSISHTTGFCGAVVARRDRVDAIGFDAEQVGAVTPEIWPQVFTGGEIAYLRSLAPLRRTVAATVIFSAKEAFYKCQFTQTEGWLDFGCVDVELSPQGDQHGSFTIRCPSSAQLTPATGRYRRIGELVLAGIAFAPIFLGRRSTALSSR